MRRLCLYAQTTNQKYINVSEESRYKGANGFSDYGGLAAAKQKQRMGANTHTHRMYLLRTCIRTVHAGVTAKQLMTYCSGTVSKRGEKQSICREKSSECLDKTCVALDKD